MIVFLFGDYLVIGDICNAFVIYGRYCVRTCLQMLKGILMLQILFCLLASQLFLPTILYTSWILHRPNTMIIQ